MPPVEFENADGTPDTAAIVADIGESLFSKPAVEASANPLADEIDAAAKPAVAAPAVEKPVVAAPVVPPVVTDPNAPAVVPGVNSEQKVLPKSWKKELAPEWDKASPALKDYVYAREADIMRGLQMYQQGHNAWDNLVSPFKPILEANPDVNPITLMQGLMATHLQLLNPAVPADQKAGMAKKLLSEYGITLEPGSAPAGDAILLERLARAENALQAVRTEQNTWKQSQHREGVSAKEREVNTFASDPKNLYFGEVADDILRFINNGAATTLEAAYDLACWANPVVRAKMLAAQQAPANDATKPRGKDGKFVNLESDGDTKARPVKVGSMDDTINGVVAKHFTTH